MKAPVLITVDREELTLKGIKQYYVFVDEKYKYETLAELYSRISISQAIIYVNKKNKAEKLNAELQRDGFTTSIIHGDMKS